MAQLLARGGESGLLAALTFGGWMWVAIYTALDVLQRPRRGPEHVGRAVLPMHGGIGCFELEALDVRAGDRVAFATAFLKCAGPRTDSRRHAAGTSGGVTKCGSTAYRDCRQIRSTNWLVAARKSLGYLTGQGFGLDAAMWRA